jgi:hypothetical protein
MESLLPISENEPNLEDYGTLFIRADIKTGGQSFRGYLVGGESFYAFGVFVNAHEFVMNLNTPDLNQKKVAEISRLLGCPPFDLFPVQYESPVRLKGGRAIAGILDV